MKFQIGAFLNLPMLEPKQFKPELEKCSKAGISLVGVMIDYPNGPANAADWLPALKRSLKSMNMKTVVHAPFTGFNLMALSPDHREASVKGIKASIDIARELDSNIVTIHAGETNKFSERGNLAKKALKDSMQSLIDYASLSGVRLSVENLPVKQGFSKSYPSTIEEAEEILSKFKELEFCIDIGHFHKSGIDVYEAAKQLAGRSNCVHLHDSTITEDHLVIGKGDIDFGRVFSALTVGGFKGAVLIEVPDADGCVESLGNINKLVL